MNSWLGRIVGPAAALVAATLLVYALKPIAPVLSLGVVYTLAVLATAIFWGLGLAVVVAVASMVAFNFLFLPPVHRLTLADGRNWTALAVYVVVAVVASELATRARRRAAEAEQREREAALLADAAAALLQEAPLDEIRARAESVLEAGDPIARARFEAAVEALLAVADERRAAEALRRSDAIKTIILHTVSHDFRTPLATMRTAIDGLESVELELTSDDRAGLLETIRIEVARLSRLVENVLDLSRLQAGAAAPQRALWTVRDLLEQAAAESADPIRVLIDLPSELPALEVDAVQIQRALVNVIDNALKFSSEDVVLVAGPEGEHVIVDVLDHGRGLNADNGTLAGLGLGLEIARGFVAVNEGQLTLEPRVSGGTRARFTLPARPLPAAVTS
jgi:two-component system sensor histidine kinase KdpD